MIQDHRHEQSPPENDDSPWNHPQCHPYDRVSLPMHHPVGDPCGCCVAAHMLNHVYCESKKGHCISRLFLGCIYYNMGDAQMFAWVVFLWISPSW